jgi:carboxyl-terminal processing protease
MLKSLDPYTVYIPESKIEDVKFMTTGQYGGIGSVIRKNGDYVVIIQPYKDSPSDKAGLIPGDIILEINGKNMKGASSEEVSELLRGEPNTKVNLKIKRFGEDKNLDFELNREQVKLNSVPYYGMLEDGIAYISLSDFTNTAYKEVKEAYDSLRTANNLKGIIIDLRSNPGGLLIEAVKICNMFIPKGEVIVSTKGKVAQWDNVYKASVEPIDKDIKIAVIVNSSSASASEIVAGAMQDLDRGVVVGQRTFGKGLVQTTRELSYNGVLKVTTAKYYIPSGRCIQAIDYSNRNEDGSVGNIPDSLVSEFKTKNGRKVYDGGGVKPDIVIQPEYLSNIAASLLIKNLIFDYSVYYKFKNPKIASVDKFVFSDADYNDFVNWVQDKDFDYTTKSEDHLNQLIESAKTEKYYDDVQGEFEILRQKLAHDKNKDLQVFKDEIKELISQEIVSKYYYETGPLIHNLHKDPEIKEAVRILKDDKEYKAILTP